MTVRYKGKDEVPVGFTPITEDNYGSGTFTGNTGTRFGYVEELVPQYDPEINPVYVLRDGSNQGIPFLLSRRKNVRLRMTWLQPSYEQSGQSYLQHYLLKDPGVDGGNPCSNVIMEAVIKRDASNIISFTWKGLKFNVCTVRCSIGEPQKWTAELVGNSMAVNDAQQYNAFATDYTQKPWMWNDAYVQYDSGGGLTLFPDLTDYEFRFENGLKPNFVFNSNGSLELSSLEQTLQPATAKLTANFTSKDFLDYLLNLTEVDLKLVMPDSKYILLSDGKFRAVQPTVKPEDLIAQKLEFTAKSWSHNF